MNTFLENVVAKLPKKVQPVAKAFVPTGVAAAVAAQDLAFSAVEVNEIKTLAIGAIASVLTYLIPNLGE